MLKEWQFNVLFVVGVVGAIVLLIGPEVGLESVNHPNAVLGIGAILAYVLQQKRRITKNGDDNKDSNQNRKEDNDGSS